VCDQDYCVDILAVREICGWTHVTPLPKAPPFIRGVINLRGSVVPILDLPVRFGLTRTGADESHVIIVVQVGERTLGLLVDEVSEILSLPPGAIKPVPGAEDAKTESLVTGVISQGERMIRHVELARIVPDTDLEAA